MKGTIGNNCMFTYLGCECKIYKSDNNFVITLISKSAFYGCPLSIMPVDKGKEIFYYELQI